MLELPADTGTQVILALTGAVVAPMIQVGMALLLKRGSLLGSAISSLCFIVMLASPAREWAEPFLVVRGLARVGVSC